MTYYYDGGAGTPGSATYTVGGPALTLPTPTYTGYTSLAGTQLKPVAPSSAGPAASYTPTGNTSLYAEWAPDSYNVTYYYDGGAGTPGSATYTVGGPALTLPTPTYTGYTSLAGTQLKPVAPSSAGPAASYTPTGNTSLYAEWAPDSYNVTYYYDGGAGTPGSATYTVGGPALTLPTPTYTGYTFLGWYSAQTGGTLVGGAGASYTPTGNTSLYAEWAPDTYNVTYYYDGGAGTPGSATYTVGGPPLTLPTPTYTGYTFLGWYSAAATGGTFVGGGRCVSTPRRARRASTPSGRLRPATYTVTY